jgi:hypothetical protein
MSDPVRQAELTMKRPLRDFIQSTTTLLDHQMSSLAQEEQHELLDALAAEVEERLDVLVEMEQS